MEQDLTHIAVKTGNDSTGCDEVDAYFKTETDTMIDIIDENDLDEDKF